MLKTLPMLETDTPIPALVRAAVQGDALAPRQIFPLIYEELRRLARNYLRRERQDHSLEPTALVHEAYARLFKNQDRRCHDAHTLLSSFGAGYATGSGGSCGLECAKSGGARVSESR